MNKYNNGKIYKLICNQTGLTYYGSTTQPLYKRKHHHKLSFIYGSKIKSAAIIEKNDYDIVLVEECPCDNKEQLHKRERFYIENNECVNKQIPLRTKKEYYQDNKQNFKNYYQANKDEKIEKSKQYYELNREKILEKHKEKLICECGSNYTKSNKIQHLKTNKHKNFKNLQTDLICEIII